MTRRFDALLFDAGGVLVLPDPTVLGPLLAYYGGDPSIDAHRRAHYAAMTAKSTCRRDRGRLDRLRRGVRPLGRRRRDRRGRSGRAARHDPPRAAVALADPRIADRARSPRRGGRADGCRVERQRPDRSGAGPRDRARSARSARGDARASSTATSSACRSPTRRSSTTPCRTSPSSTAVAIAYVGDSVTMDIASATRRGAAPDPRRPVRRPPRRRLRADPLAHPTSPTNSPPERTARSSASAGLGHVAFGIRAKCDPDVPTRSFRRSARRAGGRSPAGRAVRRRPRRSTARGRRRTAG